MEVWIVKSGRKSGPFPDYEIRERIRSGKLGEEVYGWHASLKEWQLLCEMECFRSDYEQVREEKAAKAAVVPPPLPKGACLQVPWRRFWARWMDLWIYSAIFWIGMWWVGADIRGMLESEWTMLLLYLPYFLIESWLIHRYGATPGKWLLKMRVVNDDDSLLSLRQSVSRSLRVMCIGIGFGWSLLSIVCQAFGWFLVRGMGRTLWDYSGGHKVRVESIRNPFRVALCAVVIVAAIQVESAVISRYRIEEMLKVKPELEEWFKRYPSWQLPEKYDKAAD